MSRLVDAEMVEVNERGHYRRKPEDVEAKTSENPGAAEDYFAPKENPLIVGDDYFPPPERPAPKTRRWISPEIESILNKAGKKPSKHRQSS